MIPRCNLHTHTSFCDGADTAEEMVLAAIAAGCNTLGFSGHSTVVPYDSYEWFMTSQKQQAYIEEVKRLQEKYSDRINILLGIELDTLSAPLTYKFDYIIGSAHAVVKNGIRLDVDYTPDLVEQWIKTLYGGNAFAYVKDYYEAVAKVVDVTDCDIIGHFDLISKFSEKQPLIDTGAKQYRSVALEALDALIEKNRIFEINTGAISRGWKTSPYPEDFLLRRLAEKKASVMINSDSHSKDTVTFYFAEAVEYARSCGITELCVYEGKQVKKILI